jgi:hypothetical protein
VRRRPLAIALAACLFAAPALAQDAGGGLADVDLSGAWYVLIHYKDDRSEDASITKFKDFAWSIEQTANTLTLEHYPYVLFNEDTELARRHAMRGHLAWQPSDSQWKGLTAAVDVSSRAMSRKRLTGSAAEGFESLPPLGSGGFNTMSFSREWAVRFRSEEIRVLVTDSLSGAGGLEGMEDSTVYRITERVSGGELRGTYQEPHKQGTLRMVRAAERRVVK